MGLIGLLAIVAFVAGRQFIRVRRDEQSLLKMEKRTSLLQKMLEPSMNWLPYNFGSVYTPAIVTLRQAVKRLQDEPDEARALIENALLRLGRRKGFHSSSETLQIGVASKTGLPSCDQ